MSAPEQDGIANWLRERLPGKQAYAITRWKNVLRGMAFYGYCRRYPEHAKKFFVGLVRKEVGGTLDVDRHFSPAYKPWDQRMCLVPDGDLFVFIRAGRASVVTDHIETFTEKGIRLKSGEVLEADIAVTATGLQLKFLGGLKMEVDGKAIEPSKTMAYKGHLFVALDHRDHVATDGSGHLDEHESDGAAADDGNGVADLDSGFVEAAQHAGQRLGHRRVFGTDVLRDDQHVRLNDAPGDADIFGVGSVVEQEVFAKIFLVLGAVEAHLAGGGVKCDHAHALLEAEDAFADFFDHTGQFVAEEGGRNNHAGVIAALIHLKVGAAGESHLHLDQGSSPFSHARDRHSFDLEIFFAVQDGRRHFSIHCWLLPSRASRFQLLPG